MKLPWQRHRTLTRGNETVVINYNALTQRWTEAGFYRDGALIDTTTDDLVLKAWMTADE